MSGAIGEDKTMTKCASQCKAYPFILGVPKTICIVMSQHAFVSYSPSLSQLFFIYRIYEVGYFKNNSFT